MITILLTWFPSLVVHMTPVILADDNDDGSTTVIGIGLALFTAGFLFYAAMYARYRNKGKHHHHETETEADLHDVKARDEFERSLHGLTSRSMDGSNSLEVKYHGQGIRR